MADPSEAEFLRRANADALRGEPPGPIDPAVAKGIAEVIAAVAGVKSTAAEIRGSVDDIRRRRGEA